jgi:hypothetical protein
MGKKTVMEIIEAVLSGNLSVLDAHDLIEYLIQDAFVKGCTVGHHANGYLVNEYYEKEYDPS